MTRALLLPLLLASTFACVSSDHMAVGKVRYAPRPDDWHIEVFVGIDAPVGAQKSLDTAKTAAEVPSHAIVIGRVDCSASQAASWESIVNSAKDRARLLGGDGLIVGRGSEGDLFTKLGTDLSFSVVRYR